MSEWRDIPGWNGRYQVSEDGQVRSFQPGRRAKMRKLDSNLSGHLSVLLINPRFKMMVHRAVALAFIGPQPSDIQYHVAHWDGNPKNNHFLNLRWASAKENKADGRRLNEYPKLSLTQVAEIKAKKGTISTSKLATEYGVVNSHIWRIQHEQVWA